jgi:hypothetical protein
LHVGARKAAKEALFFVVYGELGGEGVTTCAGFDLDEAERGAMPGDEVEIATEFCALPSPGDNDISKTAEMEESLAFAESACLKVRCGPGAAHGIEASEGPALRADPGSRGKSRPAGR